MSEQPQTSSPPAEATGSEACDGVGVYRVPKVQRDVIMSRLTMHDLHLSGASKASSLSSSILSFVSCGEEGDETPDGSSRVRDAALRPGPMRMPLSSIAKAEAALQKTVNLSKGGLCAEFTVEDIRRIEDADVLRYLSTSSSAQAESNGGSKTFPVEGSSVPAATTAIDIEAHMAALQKEIDTFITAVDNEGRTYEIRVGASGHVEVPIGDDDDGVSLPGGESDTVLVPTSDAAHVALSDEDAARAKRPPESTFSLPASEATLSEADPAIRPGRRAFPSKPLGPTRPAVHFNARVRQQNRLCTSVPRTRPSQPRQLSTSKPPSIPVHPQASLADGEEARVQHLLDQSNVAALMINPFVPGEEMVQRLRGLEREVRRYEAVRGVAVTESILQSLNDETNDAPHVAKTATDLGNAYMLYAREQEKAAQQRRSVNERLRALQRRAEEVALAPADDLPSSIVALRPSWAQPTAPIVEEAQVQRLLEIAREEEVRAKEANLGGASPPPTAEPLESLHRLMNDVCARATDLLATHESAPLALRAVPALEDTSDGDPEA
ncbi:hypothetical protein JKF63_06045 [Porcisia hertigi]|uniref:Uncharacterized protein n=1 Tax=Porcisia hertigi TaxID=2761500 RepID=A0A836IZ31_9TRYP|nr:hypothetical protein JKF63_06045 [Porcisia hertigi]